METLCFCGRKKAYDQCCGPILSGNRSALTAEDLMRSRYSAFVQLNIDYILSTYSNKTRPINQKREIYHWAKSLIWIGLIILRTEMGDENDSKGWVEFQATYQENGRLEILHEKSFFIKEKGNWVYVSGEYPEI